jgi:hypothetical protein
MPLSQDQNQALLDQNGHGGTAAAWSALSALPEVTYTFDIPGSPRGVGHVIVATGAALDCVGSRMLDVLTLCAEVPGEMISARSAARAGQECVYALSIDSGQREVKVRAASYDEATAWPRPPASYAA